jgi:hypothetical protein
MPTTDAQLSSADPDTCREGHDRGWAGWTIALNQARQSAEVHDMAMDTMTPVSIEHDFFAPAEPDTEVDVAVLAHWLLGRVTLLRGSAGWLAAERNLTLAERVWWLERIEDAGSEIEHVLGNLARGVPAQIAGLPYVV